MTYDNFVTLALPERIRWLHGPEGPEGKLSHDAFGARLAEILGSHEPVKRQVIIGWEKVGGTEPSPRLRRALAEFSGFPAEAFSRRRSEAATYRVLGRLLEEVAEMVAVGFEALGVEPERLRPPGGARSRR